METLAQEADNMKRTKGDSRTDKCVNSVSLLSRISADGPAATGGTEREGGRADDAERRKRRGQGCSGAAGVREGGEGGESRDLTPRKRCKQSDVHQRVKGRRSRAVSRPWDAIQQWQGMS